MSWLIIIEGVQSLSTILYEPLNMQSVNTD